MRKLDQFQEYYKVLALAAKTNFRFRRST